MSQDFEELLESLNARKVRYFGTLTFAEAWRTRVDARFGSVDAHYLGRDQLIAEKTFFDRPQDRADVVALRAKPPRAGRTPRKKLRKRAKTSGSR